jgi:UDP-N-acetylmuramate: L-alanyl-gamma-D-glutamyl-meso-diaminopimelate ligase
MAAWVLHAAGLDPADVICIRKPPLLSKVPEDDRFSSEQLVADLKKRGKDAHFFEETDDIIAFITENQRPGDIVMSNGGFDNIHARLLERL